MKQRNIKVLVNVAMISQVRGDTQIRTVVDLIEDEFTRQRGLDARPDLRVTIDLASQPVQLEVYGPVLAEHLGGVFNHLVIDAATPRRALFIELATLHEATIEFREKLSVPPPGIVVAEPLGPLMVELHAGLSVATDRAAARVTALAGAIGDLPSSHLSHPFAHVFGWLGAQRQAYITHGAAIGRDGRGLLFAGSGGQGKSTTALACAAAGWEFAGDDFMMLDRTAAGTYAAHSLYATGRLHPAQAARFPSLVANWDSLLSPEDNKLTLFPRAGAVSLVRRMTIEGIVLPIVGPDQGEITPLPRAAALRALMADSVRIYPWLTRERMQFYAEAVETLPCYKLTVGPDIAAIPAAVGRALDRALQR